MARNVRLGSLVHRIVRIVLLLVAGYGAAGLIGGAVPVNRHWAPAERGVTIWVETNGIHTGLVMPKRAADVDWRAFAPAADLRDPRHGGWDHVAIGWGEHDFYLRAATWGDLRPQVVLGAAWGSDRTLLHVEHVPGPAAGARRIVLRPEEYRRLAAFVRGTLRSRRHWPGYAGNDVFYEARGRYSAAWTCNSWTGAALRAAGVRVGWWTPFPVTVMWWF